MLHIGLVKSMLNDYVRVGLKAKLEWADMDTAFGIESIEQKKWIQQYAIKVRHGVR